MQRTTCRIVHTTVCKYCKLILLQYTLISTPSIGRYARGTYELVHFNIHIFFGPFLYPTYLGKINVVISSYKRTQKATGCDKRSSAVPWKDSQVPSSFPLLGTPQTPGNKPSHRPRKKKCLVWGSPLGLNI